MRSTLDKLISYTAFLLAAVLLLAGGLLTWASIFVGDQVHSQLTMQSITMPEGPALEGLSEADIKALEPYAGSTMDSGPEARVYADHYILAHMNESSGGKTYSEVSNELRALSPEAQASPEGEELAALKASLFQGDTLRGLLLYGYAFATMGTIAGFAAAGAFIAALLMILLGALGLIHAKKVKNNETENYAVA